MHPTFVLQLRPCREPLGLEPRHAFYHPNGLQEAWNDGGCVDRLKQDAHITSVDRDKINFTK